MAKSRRRSESNDKPQPEPKAADPRDALTQAFDTVVQASNAPPRQVRKQLGEQAERLAQSLREMEESGDDMMTVVERNVREQPLLMLMGAVGVGILIGRLIRGD
jgi:hypothetical protein